MAIVANRVLKDILFTFPERCHYAFAYGSAVFAQKHQTPGKMLDIIMVVNDPFKWHKENLQRNPHHYSGLRHFGPKFITDVQERTACGVYFNPFCEINGRVVKYGVISTAALIKDLENWNTLYVAGRLHKPVLDIRPPASKLLADSLRINRLMALRAALLLSDGIVSKYRLYRRIADISYQGDTRMRFAEAPQKTRNIVLPLMQEFDEVYLPLMKKLGCCVELPNNQIAQDLNPVTRFNHMASFPLHLQKRLVRACYKDTRDVDIEEVLLELVMAQSRVDLNTALCGSLAGIVRKSSALQTFQGLFTAGVVRSARYAVEKVAKRFRRRPRIPVSEDLEEMDWEDEPPKGKIKIFLSNTRSYLVPEFKRIRRAIQYIRELKPYRKPPPLPERKRKEIKPETEPKPTQIPPIVIKRASLLPEEETMQKTKPVGMKLKFKEKKEKPENIIQIIAKKEVVKKPTPQQPTDKGPK